MVSNEVGQVGLGLVASAGPALVLSAVAYGLVRAALVLSPADPREFVSYVLLAAALLVFGWMLACVGRGLQAINQRRFGYGIGLLLGSAMPIVGYLTLA